MERIFDGSIKSDARHRLYARIIRQARPYWLHLVGLSLLSMLASPISLLVPLPLKIAVDSAIANHPLPPFLAALLPASTVSSSTAILLLAVALLIAVNLLSQLQDFFYFVYGDLYGRKAGPRVFPVNGSLRTAPRSLVR